MSAPIRVLECIRQGQIGGGESHLLSLVQNLDRSRFHPIVLSFTDGPMVERLREMDIKVYIIPTTKPFDVRRWKAVRRLMEQESIQLVHAHGTRANSNVLWAARSLNLPVIYTIHGWSFHQDQSPLIRTVRIWGEKYLTSKSDLNISVSTSNQQSGQRFMPGFRSVVINNGIDLSKFNASRPLKDVRQELGIDRHRTLVLFLARFTSHKQPIALIRAFEQAYRKDPSLYLLMVGDGDQKKEAIDLIRSFGLEDSVTLLPFRQDVPEVLAAADMYVLPSLWEGLPIGLLEAMAMGKAVIATNVDGTCEIIEHDRNGWLIETDTLVPSLSKALNALATDSQTRKRYEEAALQTVTERFNAGNMTRKIEERYTELAGKKQLATASVVV